MHGALGEGAAVGSRAGRGRRGGRYRVVTHVCGQQQGPGRAQGGLGGAWGGQADDVLVASQDDGFGWLSLS
ncbi:hypothetical protein DIS09_14700 [Burkholderia pseudomallei]|nr:hypothetical protein DIS09_14700 [Burkholderia pseudomallei]